MSKHRGGGQPAFNRLSTRIDGMRKKWYKKKIHRANRKNLRQAIDLEGHIDKRLNPWALD